MTRENKLTRLDAVHHARLKSSKVRKLTEASALSKMRPKTSGLAPGRYERFTGITIQGLTHGAFAAERLVYVEVATRLGPSGIPRHDIAVLQDNHCVG